MFLVACNKETLNESNQVIEPIDFNQIGIRDGRIYFPNKSTFESYYKEMREKSDEDISIILENKFYSDDFYSLKPITNNANEEYQIERHLQKIKNNKSGLTNRTINQEELYEDFDDLEDVFGESLFSSFLNQDAEIQVSDKIYKYTDTGLFISDVDKIDELNEYLDQESISRNLLESTPENIKITYLNKNNPTGGLKTIGEFEHFIAENNNISSSEATPNNNYSTSNPYYYPNNNTPYYQLAQISQTLEECSGSEPWFGNLFGEVKVCKDTYESRRRVKIKYYNIDVLLVYVTGIKTKHQYKGWTGIWRQEDTSEVAMGINSISWKFDVITPPTSVLGYRPARIYLYNGKMYETTTSYFNAVYAGNIPMPNLPFGDNVDLIVEIAVGTPLLPFDDERDVTQFFYQNLFNTAKNLIESNSSRQLKRAGVVLATPSFTWIQFYDFSESCTNCSKKEHVFDFGIMSPQITYNFGVGNGGNFNITSWEFDFKNPDVVGLNAYGMAKHNNVWRGRRFVF